MTAYTTKIQELALRCKRIKTMKWLINLENSTEEFIEQDLQDRLNLIASKNFSYLIVFYEYIFKMPTSIRNIIEQMVTNKTNTASFRKFYHLYLKSFKTNNQFINYDYMVNCNLAEEVLRKLPESKQYDAVFIKKMLIEEKRIQLILLFNILTYNNKNTFLFRKKDFLNNLPILIDWINETQKLPVKELNNDDCEIIAGLLYGFDIEEMSQKLNLSSFAIKIDSINKIIENLPQKFNVQNMTQVIFRVVLFKPTIWQLSEHEEIVKQIKEINNA